MKKILLSILILLNVYLVFCFFKKNKALPEEMDSLPFSDKSGIVLATKKITIPGFDNAYNASIAPNDDGSFSLSFRYDKRMRNKHHVEKIKYYQEAFIGIVDLDSNLSPIPGSVRTIDTGSAFSEDARLFKMESDYYLIYNELEKLNDFNCHTMRISKLNKEKTKIDWTARLEQNLSVIEKNWVPFEITNEKGEKRVAFEYFINPQKVLIATDEKISTLKADIYPSQEVLRSLIWERKWGSLRGGTPAYLVDGQYLAFFHTLYRRSNNKKMAWYFMGAYTFEKTAPYALTAASAFPILFDGLFTSKKEGQLPKKLRAIYPTGYAIQQISGKDIIHVSCGENDSAIKIVTFDKEKLLQSLYPTKKSESSSFYFEKNRPSFDSILLDFFHKKPENR